MGMPQVSITLRSFPETLLDPTVTKARISCADGRKAVWALDFDGVVCNSVGESSETAWKVRNAFTYFLNNLHHLAIKKFHTVNRLPCNIGQMSSHQSKQLQRRTKFSKTCRLSDPSSRQGEAASLLHFRKMQGLHDRDLSRNLLIYLLPARYENLIQVRCLLEGVHPNDILQSWHTILPEYMDKWKQSRKEVPYAVACV